MAITTAARTSSSQPSKLFAPLFRDIEPGQRLQVLDVGLGLPDSLNFFSAYRCRLHFLNLFDEGVVKDQSNFDADELQQQFADLLRFPDDTRFDVCLFWDFLNYLDKPALRAFSRALQPWLQPSSRVHAMGVLNDRTALPHSEYAVAGLEQFSVRPRCGQQLAWYPHPQAELASKLAGLDIHKALLLPDGRLEILMGADVAEA